MNYRFFEQAYKTLYSNECKKYDIIDSFNQKVIKTGIAPTITTRPEGFKTTILIVV